MRDKVKLLAEEAGFSNTYELDRLENFFKLVVYKCVEAVEHTNTTHAYTTYDMGVIQGTIERSIKQIYEELGVSRKYKVANILLDDKRSI